MEKRSLHAREFTTDSGDGQAQSVFPCFTVFRDKAEVLLFYGGELLERLPDDREHIRYKWMVATLYNADINTRHLQEAFAVDPKTMRCWGRALEEGDPIELIHVLAGRQAKRKLTSEIHAFARLRFSQIYPRNRRSYSQGTWNDLAKTEHFYMYRSRNRANDLTAYHFEYQVQSWSKNPAMRLICVRATNPSGRTIELGILTDHVDRPAQELIWLMFHRWLQENDFKYMEKHFGINQITSYASYSYEEIAKNLEDRQMKSGEYKALEKERAHLRKKLKTELYNEHRHPDKNAPRTQRIKTLTDADEALANTMKDNDRETSRLDSLVQGQCRKLNTASKKVYDALQLIARNAFYAELAPFKKAYDNYRDDHSIFRNLTRAPGLLTTTGSKLIATLHPTAAHPPARRKLIETLFEQMNQNGLILPDGSGRRVQIELGRKEGIELATQNIVNSQN